MALYVQFNPSESTENHGKVCITGQQTKPGDRTKIPTMDKTGALQQRFVKTDDFNKSLFDKQKFKKSNNAGLASCKRHKKSLHGLHLP